MSRKIEVGIIGLGKFGFALAKTLKELGHSVVGVDGSEDRVRDAQHVLDQVYVADGTDKQALEQLRFQDLEVVALSIGSNMEASILVALNLQEMGVENLWVKAMSPAHEKVLRRLGVPNVIFPEQHVAVQLAHRLAHPDILEYLPFGEGIAIREVEVDSWAGKDLRELNLTGEYRVQVVAVRHPSEKTYDFVPRADQPFVKGDILVILGGSEDVDKITN